jgi:hypothetical protein
LVEGSFARRFDLLAERATLLTFPGLPRQSAQPVKSLSFKLKIVEGILRYR